MTGVGGDLAIDVWQFVRIMVELEARARRRRPGAAYRAWRDAWAELDRRLGELRQSDHAAFAELMMGQQVVLEAPTAAQLGDALAALEAVIAEISTALAERRANAGERADLRFERDELDALRDALARRLGARRGAGPLRHRRPGPARR